MRKWSLKSNYELPYRDGSVIFILQISPRGVVPTLVDGNFTLVEARAIATYLISQYANESQRELYPTITQDRARVDEMLYYDATVVNRTWQELMVRNAKLTNKFRR